MCFAALTMSGQVSEIVKNFRKAVKAADKPAAKKDWEEFLSSHKASRCARAAPPVPTSVPLRWRRRAHLLPPHSARRALRSIRRRSRGAPERRRRRAQEVAGYIQSFMAVRGEKAALRNDIPDEI